ncbi:cytochrome P450 [Xylaria sp. FL1042]|nr:cytochrome P450 [Xylaria sp. FL1042]
MFSDLELVSFRDGPLRVLVPQWISMVAIASLAYFLWRLWKFTLRPWLGPQYPIELPYWIPFLGHTIAFFGNSDQLLERGLNYTRRSHEIFAIGLPGKKLNIITSPSDVAAAFRDTVALRFDGHLNELLENFGFGSEALRRGWHQPMPGDWCYIPNNPVNPKQLNFIHLAEDIYKKQLLPGSKMDAMCKCFLDALHESVQWDKLNSCGYAEDGDYKRISLYSLCRFAMVDAATRSMFGQHLHDIEPGIVEHMLGFNDNAWMVFFRYPDFFGLPVTKPRREIVKALKRFIQLPESQRSQQEWSIKNIIAAQEVVGIDLEARASVILMIFWAANSNEYNTAFWVLAYLLYDDNLFTSVKGETDVAWHSGKLDIKHLCANCPVLEAVFYEALRLKGGAMISRVVLKQTTIGGKILEPGDSILIPSRQLHTNECVWGQDVKEFNAKRFLNNKALARHSSFRPFGGGLTYCPGRVLAKEEVYGFIAIAMYRFDMRLALAEDGSKPPFPVLNDTVPALGITGPVSGMDMLVDVRESNG